jgi:hypothetical protein
VLSGILIQLNGIKIHTKYKNKGDKKTKKMQICFILLNYSDFKKNRFLSVYKENFDQFFGDLKTE